MLGTFLNLTVLVAGFSVSGFVTSLYKA